LFIIEKKFNFLKVYTNPVSFIIKNIKKQTIIKMLELTIENDVHLYYYDVLKLYKENKKINCLRIDYMPESGYESETLNLFIAVSETVIFLKNYTKKIDQIPVYILKNVKELFLLPQHYVRFGIPIKFEFNGHIHIRIDGEKLDIIPKPECNTNNIHLCFHKLLPVSGFHKKPGKILDNLTISIFHNPIGLNIDKFLKSFECDTKRLYIVVFMEYLKEEIFLCLHKFDNLENLFLSFPRNCKVNLVSLWVFTKFESIGLIGGVFEKLRIPKCLNTLAIGNECKLIFDKKDEKLDLFGCKNLKELTINLKHLNQNYPLPESVENIYVFNDGPPITLDHVLFSKCLPNLKKMDINIKN